MKTFEVVMEDFQALFFNPGVKVIRIPLSVEKLKELGEAQRVVLDHVSDFERFPKANLVWYKKKDTQEPAFWDNPKAVNLTLQEAAHIFKTNPNWFNRGRADCLTGILNDFKNGSLRKTEIISVYDSSLKEIVIVEGVKRAVVLYYLYQEDPNTLAAILATGEISVVEFASPVGWFLCPCDFMPIHLNKSALAL